MKKMTETPIFWQTLVVFIMAAGILAIAFYASSGDGKIHPAPARKFGKVYRAEFEGHSYLFRDEGYRGGMCHDPDCICGKGLK